jgi:thiol-disulfide isomerase/thioredoxin
MRKIFSSLFVVLFIFILQGFGQNRSIRFIDKPWTEILAMATRENKLIFLDAYASWCGPCKWMASNIFTNDSVADYFNSTFICVSLDMEKGEGTKLRTQYEVKYYPTLLFLNDKGEIVHQRVGAARKAEDYITMGKTALDPVENLSASIKRYNSGEKSDGFIFSFLQKLSEAYLPVEPVLLNYFSQKSEPEKFNRGTWIVIQKYVTDPDLTPFGFLISHQEEYGKRFGKDSVNTKIFEVYLSALMKFSRPHNPGDTSYQVLKAKIKSSGFTETDKLLFTSDLYCCQIRGESKKFLEMAYQGVEKFYWNDPAMLNTYAYTVYQICTQQKPVEASRYLDKALSWGKKSVALKKEPANLDTYASLLNATGHSNEAIRFEKDAISLAKELSVPFQKYEETLKMMENPSEKKQP